MAATAHRVPIALDLRAVTLFDLPRIPGGALIVAGLADIAVASAIGMAFAVAGDPRMAGLAMIALWYVGMSATGHVVVSARLSRGERA